ncbi:MAG: hypothetical protein AAF570_00760 [Bacteroidota bacterium]
MDQQNVQGFLFEQVKSKLEPHQSLVSAVSDLLSLSTDSAYRRLRGDTDLSLAEAEILCREFEISMDSILGKSASTVTFSRDQSGETGLDVNAQFMRLAGTLDMILQAPNCHITYFSMELAVFHMIQIPELLAFKMHYWKLMATRDESTFPRFVFGETNDTTMALAREALKRYLRIPSTEIIFEHSMLSTLKQVHYYLDSGMFDNDLDALKLFDLLSELVMHVRAQAARGFKFLYGAPPPEQGPADNYKLMFNEMVHSQNIALVEAGPIESVFLEYNVLNFMSTQDADFCAETRAMLNTIRRKSTLISEVSERARNKYFNRLDATVRQSRARAEAFLDV